MAPNAGGEPTGEIKEAINEAFGDFLLLKKNSKKQPLDDLVLDGLGL